MNKSIVTFTRGTLAQATPLWQYDYGQVLEINGLELPTTYQVHFCNCSDTQTITVLGNADGVLIPDNLLQTGKTVIAYIYLHTGADDGETEYKITIPIRTRPAPSDIPPTPEQQSALDEAIAALNSAVDTVEDIADGIPDQINTALEEAKESGEFDGPPGPKGDAYVLTAADREEIAGIASDDVLVVSDEEPTGEPLPKIWIDDSSGETIAIPTMEDIGDLDDLVTTAKNNLVAAINEAAQSGGGGGTSDYSALTNKPQINGTTLSGNKSAEDLGLEPEAMIVTITQSGSTYSADKTYQQIREAATEGKRVIAYLNHRLFQLVSVTPSSNAAVFAVTWQGSVEYIIVDLLNAVSVQGSTIGNYSKPSGGIPKTDLASAVQTSLGKADTALQSVPSTYRTAAAQDAIDDAQDAAIAVKYTKPSGGIPKTDLAAAVQTSLSKADTALQTAPVTSVNGQTGAVSLSIPSTASEVGAVAANQGAANANKVLKVNSSGVVVPEDTRFVVTLTPTAADYSGTMDKTPAELAAAYDAGKRIIAYAPSFSFLCEMSLATIRSNNLYTFDFIALGELGGQDIMLRLLTSDTASTYGVKTYPLSIPSASGVSF